MLKMIKQQHWRGAVIRNIMEIYLNEEESCHPGRNYYEIIPSSMLFKSIFVMFL